MKEPAETDMLDAFNPEQAVATYRRVIAQRDAETTEPGRAEFQTIPHRLRQKWTDWQGEESLSEMAFGEPEE